MKNYETPIMNIDKFATENVITTSGEAPVQPTNLGNATAAVSTYFGGGEVSEDKVFKLSI